MYKIHILGEHGLYAMHDVAYIRLINPLLLLKEKDREIRVTFGKSYIGYEHCDLFVVERMWQTSLSAGEMTEFMHFLLTNNKKYIYDIDDNLLENKNVSPLQKDVIRLFLRNAECVTVSTQNLKKAVEPYNSKIKIIPNFLSLKNIRTVEKKESPMLSIVYMGTTTHQEDFQLVRAPLKRIMEKYKDTVHLDIIGAIEDTSVVADFPNTTCIQLGENSPYHKFWQWMEENAHWDIGIAPLVEDPFTLCKSDIKFLDYSAMGAAGIYSRHPAYDSVTEGETGLFAEATEESWYEALEKLITDAALRQSIAKNAKKYLYSQRLMEKNYGIWKEAIHTALLM